MCESGLRTKRCELKSLKGGFFCVWNSEVTHDSRYVSLPRSTDFKVHLPGDVGIPVR